jgi:hypothetical protein
MLQKGSLVEKSQSSHLREAERVLPYLQNQQLQARASRRRGSMIFNKASWLILTTRLQQHYAFSGISPVGGGDAGTSNGNGEALL